MSLTTAQLQALKADIAADPVLSAMPNTLSAATDIAEVYNAVASPDFVVWKTNVGADEWRGAIIGGGGATQLDALTASKRESLLWAVSENLNPSVAAIRSALDDFCGSQNTLKAAIAAVQKRLANRVEKLYATGTGSTAAPATMGYEGTISQGDVYSARNLQ